MLGSILIFLCFYKLQYMIVICLHYPRYFYNVPQAKSLFSYIQLLIKCQLAFDAHNSGIARGRTAPGGTFVEAFLWSYCLLYLSDQPKK